MQRMDITNIIKEMHIPYNSDVNTVEIYNGILTYCKQQHTRPRAHVWSINDNNILTVDGMDYLRVGPLVHAPYFIDITGPDFEGAILARQEQYID